MYAATDTCYTSSACPLESWDLVWKQLLRSACAPRLCHTHTLRRQASQKLKAAVAAIDACTYQAPCKIKVGEWLDIWVAEYLHNVKPLTEQNYKKQVEKHLKPALGVKRLESKRIPGSKICATALQLRHCMLVTISKPCRRIWGMRLPSLPWMYTGM